MKLVQIKCNDEMIDLDEPVNLRNIKKVLTGFHCDSSTNSSTNSSTKHKIQHLYSWNYDGSTILCYGYYAGKTGNENKHDLPPGGIKHIDSLDDSDTQLLYGDLFILLKTKSLCDFDVSDYGLFYSIFFEGFDECLSDESLSDESLDDTNLDVDGFIVNDFQEAKDIVDKLTNRPKLLEKVSKNTFKLAARFDWKVVIKDWEKVIEDLFNEK